ncbi:MAG: phosphomethylpyrimidine synthase ThiC, partial [Candidatus Marinamargulisbacteria bacterium]|nr:phosphomethylpyrimidine synthase ThiC [Candidatus Marinamargulisbacteria bacterium]
MSNNNSLATAIDIPTYPNSKKVYRTDSECALHVPFREIELAQPHRPFQVYDTSGVFTDSAVSFTIGDGIPKLRSPWIKHRESTDTNTQLYYARQGIITEEMRFVAIREQVPVSLVVEEIAAGRAIIP